MRAAVDSHERSQALTDRAEKRQRAPSKYIANNEGLRFITQRRMRRR